MAEIFERLRVNIAINKFFLIQADPDTTVIITVFNVLLNQSQQ